MVGTGVGTWVGLGTLDEGTGEETGDGLVVATDGAFDAVVRLSMRVLVAPRTSIGVGLAEGVGSVGSWFDIDASARVTEPRVLSWLVG